MLRLLFAIIFPSLLKSSSCDIFVVFDIIASVFICDFDSISTLSATILFTPIPDFVAIILTLSPCILPSISALIGIPSSPLCVFTISTSFPSIFTILLPVTKLILFPIRSFSILDTPLNIFNVFTLFVFNSVNVNISLLLFILIELRLPSSFTLTSPVVNVILCILKKLAPSKVIPFLFDNITSRLFLVSASNIPFNSDLSVLVTRSNATLAGVIKLLFLFIIPAILVLPIVVELFKMAPFLSTLNLLNVESDIPFCDGVDMFITSTSLFDLSTYTFVFPSGVISDNELKPNINDSKIVILFIYFINLFSFIYIYFNLSYLLIS